MTRRQGRRREVATRTVAVIGLAVLAVAVLAACGGSGSGAAPGDTATTTPAAAATQVAREVQPVGQVEAGTVTTPDGRTRTYHLYIPASLPQGAPVPLFVGLHGGLGSGEQFAANSRLDYMAEANGFLAVFPTGSAPGRAATRGAPGTPGTAAVRPRPRTSTTSASSTR